MDRPPRRWLSRNWLPAPLAWLRIKLTAVMLWWALILASPMNTLDSSAGYRPFLRFASEPEWSAICFSVFLISCAGFKWRCMRRFSAHVLSIAHGSIAILLVVGNPASTGSGVYALLAASAGYLVIMDYD